jgi:hypothetical protein
LSPVTTIAASLTTDGLAIVIIRAARITVVCGDGVCAFITETQSTAVAATKADLVIDCRGCQSEAVRTLRAEGQEDTVKFADAA